tara:strand:+ start:8741 stop:9118 length:378 start_codon:yes stop_codon:yes gene_type:complete
MKINPRDVQMQKKDRMYFLDKIIIPEGNKKHLFNRGEIKFIKSDKYYMNVYCIDRRVLIRITMKQLENILPSNFLRINKSVIVNMSFVVRIEESKSSCCVILPNEIEHQVTEKFKLLFDSYFIHT